jgi:serine/threonine protein kinase
MHRDIKPANVMLPQRRCHSDRFRRGASSAAQFTATGAITGTPDYMSPERVKVNTAMGAVISTPWGLSCMKFSPGGCLMKDTPWQ